MSLFNAVILGLVQGLTEFLPISSSGHIFLLERWMGLVGNMDFTLWLHLGSLIAVVLYFRRDIMQMILGTLQMIQKKQANVQGIYTLKLLTATFATVPTALLMLKFFPYSELSLRVVGITLLLTAVLIVFAERARRSEQSLSWPLVIVLGLVQGLAIVPGISRSGLTIAILILLGISRQLAARTSFLLAIPTILGAGIYSYIDQGERFTNLGIFELTAVAVAAISAYVAIAWMMRWVEGRWIYFAYYCVALGVIVLFLG
ncbi:MAG: undecaprenyl-diphosphate phosphatase [Patescibacteria group bacterium]